MRSEKPICAPPRLSDVSPTSPLKWFQCSRPFSSFQGRSSRAMSFYASLLQAIDGVMSLALCPHVVSEARQYFRSSKTQATCDGCFARQSVCSVVSLHSGMSRTRRFRRWMSHSSLGLNSHFTLYFLLHAHLVCKDGSIITWSDCHLLRQSSGGHG